ncbi:hypothetical protein PGAG_00099 [Phaeocystis globosa virus 12T]|uniref:Multiple copy protein PGV_MIGE n=1 Tax=Phaeocystis globosa virus PgV-16T TaxID=3071227 RepID=A0AC59EWY7_9VIRU|nr:multiple copy protein PGV_MIGE [Phaeocystis globosa virus]AET72988.1 hypothetical protein PGAG_00099 [Phaeocystis globosa virus 12T]AET73809.1 hypothetical protein PGBG_00101 [Phaeocystis globosa virus 14T]AGM15451.1 multiple copy protein PGV_MIGE [Phaeocystis globosa virus PgV-16T]UYE94181.1 multiple copy protein [Phaeocystis globosa virus]
MDEDRKVEKVEKVEKKYNCVCCDYFTSRKEHYIKHLSTQKHKQACNRTNEDNLRTNEDKNVVKVVNEKFGCDCGKTYKYKRGLWNHQQTCNYGEPVCVEIKKTTEASDDVVAQLLEQNKNLVQQHKMEMMEQKMEMMKETEKQNKEQMELLTTTFKDMAGNMGSHNTTNNTNNQFNINMFLNEECKDAINLSDFIKSIQVSLDQLQYTTNNGLCKGITRVIMDNMNKLSKYERPLHCSDLKRETIYIKDNDKWEKDTHKEKLKKVIEKTSSKNYTALTEWTKENPHFMKCDDKQMFYARSISAMGKPITGVEDKIIKSICKDYQVKE